jgi:hypothetical protein
MYLHRKTALCHKTAVELSPVPFHEKLFHNLIRVIDSKMNHPWCIGSNRKMDFDQVVSAIVGILARDAVENGEKSRI